jgi:hypothetical protein
MLRRIKSTTITCGEYEGYLLEKGWGEGGTAEKHKKKLAVIIFFP